jgi:hypothetical protein
MQPYFFPYVGYFQLIGSVDLFIVYDNIKFTKKGWINRNRMLLNGKDALFSLPVESDSDYLDVRDRKIAREFNPDKLLNQLSGAYGRAPHFSRTFALIERIVRHNERNLFRFLHNSIVETCEHLGVRTKIRISSEIDIDHQLKSKDRVLALCDAVGADSYVNAIGGTDLYSKEEFLSRRVNLTFIKSHTFEYPQFGEAFVPWLSIIDVMMFNSLDVIRTCVSSNYELV